MSKVTYIIFWLLITKANFLTYRKMSSISYKEAMSALTFCFTVLGTTEEIICYNGTQFTSKEYKEYVDKCRFTMTISSPHYPRGHGFIKRQSKIIKKLFKSCGQLPLAVTHHPQAEFLNGRWMKTTLPATIKPPQNSEAVRASLQSRQDLSTYDT